MAKKDKRLDLRITKELKEAARRKAEAEGISLSEALRLLLEKYVGNKK